MSQPQNIEIEQTQPLPGQLNFGEEVVPHPDPDYLIPDNDLFKNIVRKAIIPPVKLVVGEVREAPAAGQGQGGRRRSHRRKRASYHKRKSHRRKSHRRKTHRR